MSDRIPPSAALPKAPTDPKYAKSISAALPSADERAANARQVQTIRGDRRGSGSGIVDGGRVRRRSAGSDQDMVSRPQKTTTPELTKAELEKYINLVAEKSRLLARLCTINTAAEAAKFTTKLVLFDFKEVNTIINEVMDKLSSQVAVTEIYDACIALGRMEKFVISELEALQTTGKQPEFSTSLKSSLLALLSAVKKTSSEYVHSLAKEPLPLVIATPGFRAELGRYTKPSLKNTMKHRLSYSFSASASVVRPGDDSLAADFKMSYADYRLDHVDYDASFYRQFFFGQEHRNYVGIDEKYGPIAISVKKERVPTKNPSDPEEWRYRGIFRTKEGCDLRTVFPESSVITSSRIKSKPSWNDVVSTINPSIHQKVLKRIEDPKIQDELLKFDEHQWVKKFKFGILYCKAHQKKEEEMFGNEHGSAEYEEFLNFIGKKILLKGHTGHVGGLDKKNDTTGTHSVYATWRDMEIMFHVSTLLPYSTSPDDKQQIQRKRHIGNDIVTIIYMDGNGQWSPLTIKSQFLHIFVVVQRIPSQTPGVRRYRVAVISNEDVPEFGPDVPKPAEFDEGDEFRHFLFAKMINGENAAYKAPKFREPHVRARQGLIEYLVETFCNAAVLKSATLSSSSTASIVGQSTSPKQAPNSQIGSTNSVPEEFKAKDLFVSENRQNLMKDIKRVSMLRMEGTKA